jgi:hypothetical protein
MPASMTTVTGASDSESKPPSARAAWLAVAVLVPLSIAAFAWKADGIGWTAVGGAIAGALAIGAVFLVTLAAKLRR